MQHILGLDLGTTSIGWAHVIEADQPENSRIVDAGVRVNPLTTDEQTNFEKGKPITTNANRTSARSARRNLQRYKLRRDTLIDLLRESSLLPWHPVFAENGKNTTFETYRLRALAASEPIALFDFFRVLLMINKKRGYKSSRKVNKAEDGQSIDGMEIARKLYDDNLTPGQYVLELLQKGVKKMPDFYRSDLQNEFAKIWQKQTEFYPELLTEKLKEELLGKGKVTLKGLLQLVGIKRDKKGADLKVENYEWRVLGLTEQLSLEQLSVVLQEINGQMANSSGYLGAISDRSKELYFKKQTVGQYLYAQLEKNPHARLKNQVFYRQDYLDEFERIWSVQAQAHPHDLSDELKSDIRDIIIFYQRKLKSQKGLISLCEFEQKVLVVNGKPKKIGMKVIPKSSPLFQEFKIWQNLHNVRLKHKKSKEVLTLSQEDKHLLFEELNLKGNLSASQVLALLVDRPKDYELNYTKLEGNKTNEALYNAYLNILDVEGYDVRDELKVKLKKDDITLADLEVPAREIRDMVARIFDSLGINSAILAFQAELEGKDFEAQPAFQMWHLLYSYEEDDSTTGMERLYRLLQEKFGFSKEHTRLLGAVSFQPDYGSLSAKAIRKIYTFIKENEYSVACELVGYRHSKHSLTKEELENRVLKDRLDVLSKNELRNPVVEKILNQMVNVVNTILDTESKKLGEGQIFRFDEIRIELARELKKSAKEREELTKAINAAKIEHDKIVKDIQKEFGHKNPTRNDIIRYKLYNELKNNGYKDLYTNTYIQRDLLFSKEYDIEHIIPQSRLFDDSFSNKTLVPRQVNLEKGNKTAYDYVLDKFGESGAVAYEERIAYMYNLKEEGISKAKYKKLLMRATEIGEGFIERDLRDSQYIARKAKEMLFEITRSVITTTGAVTDRLRNDWGLVEVMKELNLPKYKAVGLTEIQTNKEGHTKEVIVNWTKRNDHRHHAMDAITIAFTKHSHIQYLNNLNARRNEAAEKKANIWGIEQKETYRVVDKDGNSKRLFKEPIPHFRHLVKNVLEGVLVSHKAKNKVVTRNINIIKGGRADQLTLTPRGQLHKETVYGKNKVYAFKEEKVGPKMDASTIQMVTHPVYKALLIQRLASFEYDPKKAFSSKNTLAKNPIILPDGTHLPEKVRLMWLEDTFTIRKEVSPDLKLDKVVDKGVRRILEERLAVFNGDAKKAFSDLEQNPIWLNKEKGIAIKRVKIAGVSNAEALHNKKDHLGYEIPDANGNPIPVDYVSTGNNHHVAIYEDEKGNLQENVVSFFEAVARVNQGLPVVDKAYNAHLGWKFKFTMKQNEMFVFPSEDFNPAEVDLLNPANKKLISKNLFRVQKFTTKDYFFRHHLETNVEDISILKTKTWRREGLGGINGIIKLRLNHLGQIVAVVEE